MKMQDIAVARYGVLAIPLGAPNQQMVKKELEHLLHAAQSTAAGIMTRPEQKGTEERFSSQGDRQIKAVRLTRAGMGRPIAGVIFDTCGFLPLSTRSG